MMRHYDTTSSATVVIQRAWRHHMVRMMMRIRTLSRQMARCVVCNDECVTLFRCEHGHGCCVGCDASITDQRCPICRESRHAQIDETFKTVLYATDARHLCSACNVYVKARDCEHHRAWCPSHKFTCPLPSCRHTSHARHMAQHVQEHDGVVNVPREFVVVINRNSDDVVLAIDNDVIVISATQRSANSLNEIILGGIIFGIRCYYSGPNVGVWTCTVRQIHTSTSDVDDLYVEEYQVGLVPPMIASREQIVVAPYVPNIIPRCADTSGSALRTAIVLAETGAALSQRLANHGIRDLPWITKPAKNVALGGPPTCVLRIRLHRLTASVGSIFVD